MEMLKKSFLSILVSMIVLTSYGQSYEYPIKPSDEAWKNITNGEELYSKCQIPNDLLKSMKTSDLVATCLKYPLISTIFAHNDYQMGFDALSRKFNGFQELLTRKDAGKELVKVYKEKKPESFNKEWTDVEKGNFTFEFTYLEILLSQKKIQKELSNIEKEDLISSCLIKYEDKNLNIDLFGTLGIATTAWVISRTMNQEISNDKDKNDEFMAASKLFFEQGLVVDFDVIDQIIEEAKIYVK